MKLSTTLLQRVSSWHILFIVLLITGCFLSVFSQQKEIDSSVHAVPGSNSNADTKSLKAHTGRHSQPGRNKRKPGRLVGDHSKQKFMSGNRTTGLSIKIQLEPIPEGEFTVPEPWGSVQMPKKSYYSGFEAPNDAKNWKIAQLRASRGEQVLLSKVLEAIRSPFDFIVNDKFFKYIQRLADVRKSKEEMFNGMENIPGHRAIITTLGYKRFDRPDFEGFTTGDSSMSPTHLIRQEPPVNIPRKIIGIGQMDENWGWLSTYFLNRTITWAMSFDSGPSPFSPKFKYCLDEMKAFLDNPNLVMLMVNQHHNCSHPKVISFPLGVNTPREAWHTMHRVARNNLKKDQLFFSAGSNFAFRPDIRSCIASNIGSDMIASGKIDADSFRIKLATSYAVLTMPGLGIDTYRLWETLASGSLPVQEKGTGLDRTLYKLPVLLLDDYAYLTPTLLREAYVEAIYRADEWEYERMTKRYWETLLFEVAESSSIDYLLEKHPMSGYDSDFIRPFVPFDCKEMGGCGPGTKRTPEKYCAIDPKIVNEKYNFFWNHYING